MDTIDGTFNEMTDAMTAVDASPGQVRGIARWRDQVDAAVAAGYAAGGAHPGLMRADAVGSHRHALWLATAGAVITTMDMQAAEARGMAEDAREMAEDARRRSREHQAAAAAAGDEETAAAFTELAEVAARGAGLIEDEAEACDAWAAAAACAAAAGRRLAASEDAVHRPVGEAYALAGGRAWIAGSKHFIRGD